MIWEGERRMLHYALVFFIVAVLTAIFGFSGIAVAAAEIAKGLFFVFVSLAAVSFVLGILKRTP
jgi:uncharacterized membrane protein YtjA (UPF0391 family)